jgi:DNA primase
MTVTQAGYPCVALMGSTMSKTQENLLAENFAHVIVMLDGNGAGRVEIADRLQRVVFQVQLVELVNDVQPDQLSEEELQRALSRMMVGK